MRWIRTRCKGADGISSGDYRIHKDGVKQYTAYRRNPFKPLGHFTNVDEAKQLCKQTEKRIV